MNAAEYSAAGTSSERKRKSANLLAILHKPVTKYALTAVGILAVAVVLLLIFLRKRHFHNVFSAEVGNPRQVTAIAHSVTRTQEHQRVVSGERAGARGEHQVRVTVVEGAVDADVDPADGIRNADDTVEGDQAGELDGQPGEPFDHRHDARQAPIRQGRVEWQPHRTAAFAAPGVRQDHVPRKADRVFA